jgi:hypothetical protein
MMSAACRWRLLNIVAPLIILVCWLVPQLWPLTEIIEQWVRMWELTEAAEW